MSSFYFGENYLDNKRIIFLDWLRAYAVLMMVQGHTIDALLENSLRTENNVSYQVWLFFRGFSAPVFMFTAGAVFNYLLKKSDNSIIFNQRVIKGIKRSLLLILIGYLLRYPTYTLVYFNDVTDLQWKVFFGVDALHNIGISLLILILLNLISFRYKINRYLLLSFSAIFFIALSPIISESNFKLHPILSNYLNSNNGSFFPLFPWSAYLLLGGIFGNIIVNHNFPEDNFKFSKILFLISVPLIILFSPVNFGGILNFPDYNLVITFFFRFGSVLFLISVFAFVSKKVKSVPEIIKIAGRHSLNIYIFHLVIIFGSAWNIGVVKILGKSLNGYYSVLSAIFLLILTIGFVYLIENFKNLKNSRKRIEEKKF